MVTFGGLKVVVSEHLLGMKEDWSKVRSPSRAKRRLKQGHRQNIKYFPIEFGPYLFRDCFLVGPNTYLRLKDEFEQHIADAFAYGTGAMHIAADRARALSVKRVEYPPIMDWMEPATPDQIAWLLARGQL